jgi:antitoxin component of RelBE/YafQ-DinJ toxin-antitoxin module
MEDAIRLVLVVVVQTEELPIAMPCFHNKVQVVALMRLVLVDGEVVCLF